MLGGPLHILEVTNMEVVVEVEVFKEENSIVASKGMGSAARGWVAEIASRQHRAQSPGMHTALHGMSMLCVRDDLLRLQQLLFDVQLQRRFLDSTTAAKGSATPAVVLPQVTCLVRRVFLCLIVIF